MTDCELMQQAVEALEFFWNAGYRNIADQQKALITALRERLARQEQELVGWVDGGGLIFWKDKPPADGSDLYTAPQPAQQPLTEDSRRLEWLMHCISGSEFRRIGVHYVGNVTRQDIDSAIEAAHGIKENI